MAGPVQGNFCATGKKSQLQCLCEGAEPLCSYRELKWTVFLGPDFYPKSSWQVLHKVFIDKRSGNLQRIVDVTLAINRYKANLDSEVGKRCSFCGVSEMVFHISLSARMWRDYL